MDGFRLIDVLLSISIRLYCAYFHPPGGDELSRREVEDVERPLLTSDSNLGVCLLLCKIHRVRWTAGCMCGGLCVTADQDSSHDGFLRKIEFRVFLWVLLQHRSVVNQSTPGELSASTRFARRVQHDPFRRCARALSSRSASTATFLVDAWGVLFHNFFHHAFGERLFH